MLRTKDLPENDRPYEKCEQKGPQSLSDAELLAVVIKTGTKSKRSVEVAQEILALTKDYGGLSGLNQLTAVQLMKISGIGRVKAIQILCVMELSRRLAKAAVPLGDDCSNAGQIASHYMEVMRHYREEHLLLLMLNTRNKKIAETELTKGSVNAAFISVREIFTEALRHDAVNIILLHNHPSGDPTPSPADISITKDIARAGDLIGIHLLDHIIIGGGHFKSLYKEGYLSKLA